MSNRSCLSSCDWWSARYRCLSSDWCWWASWSSDAWRTYRWWGSGCISRTSWRCPRLSWRTGWWSSGLSWRTSCWSARLSLWLSNRGCLSSCNWWSTRCRSLSSNRCWWGSWRSSAPWCTRLGRCWRSSAVCRTLLGWLL